MSSTVRASALFSEGLESMPHAQNEGRYWSAWQVSFCRWHDSFIPNRDRKVFHAYDFHAPVIAVASAGGSSIGTLALACDFLGLSSISGASSPPYCGSEQHKMQSILCGSRRTRVGHEKLFLRGGSRSSLTASRLLD